MRKETLGKYIKRMREKKGIFTSRALAKHAGVSSSALAKIEADESKPDHETVEKLAVALGVPVLHILDTIYGNMRGDGRHPFLVLYDELPPQHQKMAHEILSALVKTTKA